MWTDIIVNIVYTYLGEINFKNVFMYVSSHFVTTRFNIWFTKRKKIREKL